MRSTRRFDNAYRERRGCCRNQGTLRVVQAALEPARAYRLPLGRRRRSHIPVGSPSYCRSSVHIRKFQGAEAQRSKAPTRSCPVERRWMADSSFGISSSCSVALSLLNVFVVSCPCFLLPVACQARCSKNRSIQRNFPCIGKTSPAIISERRGGTRRAANRHVILGIASRRQALVSRDDRLQIERYRRSSAAAPVPGA